MTRRYGITFWCQTEGAWAYATAMLEIDTNIQPEHLAKMADEICKQNGCLQVVPTFIYEFGSPVAVAGAAPIMPPRRRDIPGRH